MQQGPNHDDEQDTEVREARVAFFTLTFCFLTIVFLGTTNLGRALDLGDSEAGLFDFFLCRKSISGFDTWPSDFEALPAAAELSLDSSDCILNLKFKTRVEQQHQVGVLGRPG